MIGWMMFIAAHDMARKLVEKMLEAEKEKLTEALGREPTVEEWQYYRDLQWQKANRDKARQREIDREKLRRLVMGEDAAAA
jgi:hypothetical protein